MRDRDRLVIVLLLTLAFVSVGLPAAHAYVDPGTGSFIFQALVGGLLAGALALKVFWRRIVGWVTRRGGASQTATRSSVADHDK